MVQLKGLTYMHGNVDAHVPTQLLAMLASRLQSRVLVQVGAEVSVMPEYCEQHAGGDGWVASRRHLQSGPHSCRGEAGQEVDGSAGSVRAQQGVGEAVHVVQRQGVQDAVLGLPFPGGAQRPYHGAHAAVRVQHPWRTRRMVVMARRLPGEDGCCKG